MTELTASGVIIEDLILEIRGQRNQHRFPKDFMFELNTKETSELVANCDRFNNTKHSSVSPPAFTKHGALMLASILNSQAAIETSVQVIRAFVRMRNLLTSSKELANKIKVGFQL